MKGTPLLTAAALWLHYPGRQHHDPGPIPATVSVQLTGRLFHTLYVQLAGANGLRVDRSTVSQSLALEVHAVQLSSVADPLQARLDWHCSGPVPEVHARLDLTIEDASPAGPYTVTQPLGALRPGRPARTINALFPLECLQRPLPDAS